MRPAPWVGLIAAGPVSPSLYKLANWNATLGPVCAETLRVASRLANQMKAGAAAKPEALANAQLILISGPCADFDSLLELARNAAIDWKGRTVLLVDSLRGPEDLDPLRTRGAFTGTINTIEAFPNVQFSAAIDTASRRMLQRFCTATHAKAIAIPHHAKHLFDAGAAFVSDLMTPSFTAAFESLKHAGLTQPEAEEVIERIVHHELRAWRKASRKTWTPPDSRAAARQQNALAKAGEQLKNYYDSSAQAATGLFAKKASAKAGGA